VADNKFLNIAVVQHSCGKNREENLAASVAGIRDAALQGAKLIVLQELHTSSYFCQTEDPNYFDLAETIPGATSDFLGEIATQLNVVIVAALFERRAPGIYHNTAVTLDSDGRIAGLYRKMHIPDDPGYYEKYYFTPGDLGFNPISTSIGKLGVLICWDQWFPEAARLMAIAGADLLIYPSAIGWDLRDPQAEQMRQYSAWVTVQLGHAIANGIPIATCNRVGHEPDPSGNSPGIQFWGGSFIADAQGEILARANTTAEIITAQIELGNTEKIRRAWPFLRDRRTDNYAELTKRWRY